MAKDPKFTHLRVSVRSRALTSFRRAGFEFGQEPRDIPLADLSDEKLAALESEPSLVATRVNPRAESQRANAGSDSGKDAGKDPGADDKDAPKRD